MGICMEIIFTDSNGWYRGIKYFTGYVSQSDILGFKNQTPFGKVFLGEFYEVEECYSAIRVKVSQETENYLLQQSIEEELSWLMELANAVKFAVRHNYYLTLIGV